MISLLSGHALQWAQSLWKSDTQVTNLLSSFIRNFKEVFRQSASVLSRKSFHDQLLNLLQGDDSVSLYALQFRTLAASSGWNEAALLTTFCQGLNAEVHQYMVIYEDVIGLENFIQKAIRVSQHLSACSRHQPALHSQLSLPSIALPAPDASRLLRPDSIGLHYPKEDNESSVSVL